MYMIAVDIGSTYVKAALCDMEGGKLEQELKFPTPGRLENPDAQIYENRAGDFVEITEAIIQTFAKRYRDICGILFSTQMHGCVLSHPDLEQDRYISWQDARCLNQNPDTGESYLDMLHKRLNLGQMEGTGVCLKPALALCNLFTLFESGGLKKNPAARADTLGSYLIARLTGRHICHITNAAPMGFADIRDGQWKKEILEAAGLDFLQLPEIVSDLSCCGYYRKNGMNLSVFPDIGDVQASVFGSGAQSGDLVVNIATAGQLILVQDQFCPGNYEIRPYFDGKYCNVISRMPAGRNLDVQIDYMAEIGEKIFDQRMTRAQIWNRLHGFCQEADTQGLEVDVSFYELPDQLADGGIFHINRSNLTIQNVINAARKDFGRIYKNYAQHLLANGVFSGRLIFAGGAVLKNQELREAITAAMGAKHVLLAPEDEVYVGMLRLAQRCMPEWGKREEGRAYEG